MKQRNKVVWIVGLSLLVSALLLGGTYSQIRPRLSKVKFHCWKQCEAYKDNKYIKSHCKKALASLEHKKDPFEVAGAINDYVYQYFILKNNLGSPVKLLKEGYGYCGAHAVVMSTLLSSCGIKNKLAYLIDVPYQGAHSLVQVYFKNGGVGLYDPTFGVFWFDQEHNQSLSIKDLKAEPKFAISKLVRTSNWKRKDLQEKVKPFLSVSNSYKSKPEKDEEHYEEMFSTYAHAGTAGYEFKVFKQIPFNKAPQVYGDKDANEYSNAFMSIAALKIDDRYSSWLHYLGKCDLGYNLSHIYNMRNLEAGKKYRLTLYFFKSIDSKLSTTLINAHFVDTTLQTKHDEVNNFYLTPEVQNHLKDSLESRKYIVTFVPEKEDIEVIINNEGLMLLQALALE